MEPHVVRTHLHNFQNIFKLSFACATFTPHVPDSYYQRMNENNDVSPVVGSCRIAYSHRCRSHRHNTENCFNSLCCTHFASCSKLFGCSHTCQRAPEQCVLGESKSRCIFVLHSVRSCRLCSFFNLPYLLSENLGVRSLFGVKRHDICFCKFQFI